MAYEATGETVPMSKHSALVIALVVFREDIDILGNVYTYSI